MATVWRHRARTCSVADSISRGNCENIDLLTDCHVLALGFRLEITEKLKKIHWTNVNKNKTFESVTWLAHDVIGDLLRSNQLWRRDWSRFCGRSPSNPDFECPNRTACELIHRTDQSAGSLQKNKEFHNTKKAKNRMVVTWQGNLWSSVVVLPVWLRHPETWVPWLNPRTQWGAPGKFRTCTVEAERPVAQLSSMPSLQNVASFTKTKLIAILFR